MHCGNPLMANPGLFRPHLIACFAEHPSTVVKASERAFALNPPSAQGRLLAHRDICCGCTKAVGVGANRTSTKISTLLAGLTATNRTRGDTSRGSNPWPA